MNHAAAAGGGDQARPRKRWAMTERLPQREPVIAVGLDETPSARSALRWAARQARLTGSIIQAIHVLDWPIGMTAFSTELPDGEAFLDDNQVNPPYRRGMQRLFSEVDPAPEWSLQFAVGDASRILIRAATDADLLVIGARNPANRAADWHVRANLFLSYTSCPVVMVPTNMPSTDSPSTFEVDVETGRSPRAR